MKKFIALSFVFFLGTTSFLSAQNQSSQKEMFQASYNTLKQMVQSKDFKFVGEVVYNNKNRELLNSEENTLAIKASKITGTVQSLGDTKNPVSFSDAIENYNVNFDDEKQVITFSFTANNHEVNFRVMPNSNVFLTVRSSSGNIISQTGKLTKG